MKFFNYIKRYKTADEYNYIEMKKNLNINQFKAAFFILRLTRVAFLKLRPLFFYDRIYTFFIFNVILMTFLNINTNKRGLFLIYIICLIENKD